WGVKPAGDHGGYLQTVRVLGIKATSRSTVTVRVGSESRTFEDGDGVTFPRNAGAKRTVTLDRVEFAGYGLDLPGHLDLSGRNVGGAAVVFLGRNGPKDVDRQTFQRVLAGRSRHIIGQLRAGATIGASPANDAPPNTSAAAPGGAARSGTAPGN